MRVLFPFVGDTVGGSHVSAIALARGLEGSRFEPVVAVHRKGPLQDYLRGQAVPFLAAPDVTLATIGASLPVEMATIARAAAPLVRFLVRNRIDIVHTNDSRMHATWVLPAKLSRARLVWHQRSSIQSRRVAYYSRLADSVLTISQYCRDSFLAGMSERAQVVINPFATEAALSLDRGEQRDALLRQADVRDVTAVIGCVTNFTHQKRPLLFVDAAARLRDTFGPGLLFPMIGGDAGSEMGQRVRRRIADHGLDDRCLLLGPQFPIEPWLAGFDILLAPAVAEGFGRTLVEAMVCGTPVVASDAGGHREIIAHEETGLLVPPDDTEALAAAASRLLGDPDAARRLAETARTVAVARYSTAQHVAQVQAVYESLVGR